MSVTTETGEFAFSGLPPAIYDIKAGSSTVTVDLRSRFWARVSVGCASTSGVVYSVGRSGPRAIHTFALRLPQCPHPNPAFSPATCLPNGDTLPAGPDAPYSLSIFDTGSTTLLVSNSDPQGLSDAKHLKLCEPANDCQPTSTGNYPPYYYLPDSLDVLIWGLGAVNPTALTVPITTPQAQVAAIKVRPYSTPTFIGAPVAARVIAEINYRRILSRNFSFGLIEAADIAFYPENGAGIPTPSYQLQLEKNGGFGTSPSDGASFGPRYQLKNAILSNLGKTVADGSSYQFLFDTGNTTTQATAAVAQALGIDVVNDTPVDTYTETAVET